MKFSSAGVLVLFLIVPMVVEVHAVARRPKRREESDRPTYTAKDEQLEQLPDYGDPKVNKALKCSSCNALAKEVYEKLVDLGKRRNGRPRQYEVAEALEDICPTLRDEYGLLLKNNKPTTVFSRNKAITRMQGSWINSFIDTRCGELLSSHEEQMIEWYPKVKDLEEFRELVCIKWEKTCQAAEIHDEF